MKFNRFMSLLIVAVLLLSFVGCADKSGDASGTTAPFLGHMVYFATNGGESLAPMRATTLNSPPTPKRSGYKFEGWYLDEQLTQSAVFPIKLTNDISLYAKWLKIYDAKRCKDTEIKLSTKYSAAASYAITPTGFNYSRLNELDYSMTITVTYDVYYEKDYDVLWDIGYMGSPKYEVFLTGTDLSGDCDLNMSTSKTPQTRSISITVSANSLANQKEILLTFSTDNVQNIIYFENITVTYECH